MDIHTLPDRYAKFVLRHRWVFMFVMFGFTIISAFYVNDVNLRNDPDSLFPLSNRYIATNLYSEVTYGMGNLMVWGLEVKEGDIFQPWFIKIVDELYDEVTKLAYANPDNFIGIASTKVRSMGLNEDGNLEFKRLIPVNGLSKDPEEAERQVAYLKTGLQRHPVMEPLLTYYEDADGNKCELLDADGRLTKVVLDDVHSRCAAKATFIIGDFSNGLKNEPLNWIRATKAQLAGFEERYGDRVNFIISGEPYFLTSMIQDISDNAWLFGVSLLIILLVLWYEYRSFACAIFPIIGVGMTIVLTLGLMGFTEFRLTTMMVLTPMLLLAIGIGHSMQITRRFMQEFHKSGDAEKAAEVAIRYTIVPAALSIGTDLHGFFALSFVDISFYKAYAYFGIFGMSTLILTTTSLIPLLMIQFPPNLKNHSDEREWESKLGVAVRRMLTSRWKIIPSAFVAIVITVAIHYTGMIEGVSALMAGEEGRSDPEVARIQDEWDLLPGVEKGINYPRAAFKDHYMLGEWLTGNGEVRPIRDLNELSKKMPGVITANFVVRSIAGTLPKCGLDAWDDDGERVIGPDQCFDEQEDPQQGIFNDAEVLAVLSEFEDWLRSQPYVGYTASYVQFIKTMNMILNAPETEQPMDHMNLYAIPTAEHIANNWYAYADPEDPEYVPDPDEMVAFYNGLMANSTGPGDLDGFINTRNWDEGIIVGFVNTFDPVKAHQTVLDIQQYIIDHEDEPGWRKIRIGVGGGEYIDLSGLVEGVSAVITDDSIPGKAAIGGFLGVTEATREVAFHEFFKAPAGTSLTVFTMTVIMFQSWQIAFMLISVCYITLFAQYGLGGYMTSIGEWSANLAFHVQVALSIAMGLGIDYGVYIVSRLREEMTVAAGNWEQALERTISSTGSAIVISVVVLLGSFIPLMNTESANLWSVSVYISLALILDVILALSFLPMVVGWIKPRFVFQNYATGHRQAG